MDKRPVLFLDSGIGGTLYCRHFHKRNPGERVVYLADRLHFPYGKRDRADLVSILTALVEKLIRSADPKIVVLACNTAAVSALDPLRERFPSLLFVGTVPAVKPAALASKTGKVGVLGTGRTIEEPYIRRLAVENGGREIYGVAAPDLVELVEHRLFLASEDEKRSLVREYLDRFRAAGVDAVALGCTHFLFLLEEFQREAAPDVAVFDSVEGISRRVESLLDEGERLRPDAKPDEAAANISSPENILLVTGTEAPGQSWRQWADYLGFRLSLLAKV